MVEYKHHFGIFCKSYRGDIERVVEMSKSINEYNTDNVPFYISVPPEDVAMFKQHIPYYTEIIDDRTITDNYGGWHGQQYVKAKFYKTNLCRFYLVIDSDSYFIKPFAISDFLVDNETPYMVMHQHEDMLEWTDRYARECFHFDPRKTFEEQYTIISNYMGRKGKLYHYGPTPCIWDSEVWRWADEKYTIDKLFSISCTEIKWYGELVLAKGDKFLPCGPLFKVFHYRPQYEFYKQLGWTVDDFRHQYFGIILQSNWGAPKRYEL